MPALLWAAIRALFPLLAKYLGPILVQVLLFFGLQLATQKFAVGPIVTFIQNALSGAPAIAVQSMAAVRFDQAITIILSAYVTRAASRVFLKKVST